MNLNDLDSQSFGTLAEPYRRELQVHCYRMLGTFQDSEDMVQETFLRAWRGREGFEGRASFRAWLYKIATNACLDRLRQASRRGIPRTHQPVSTAADPIPADVLEPIWLEPYPDDLLAPADSRDPAAQIAARETITLAFMAALHLLPPRQRAVLLLRDVLDWRAAEVADLLDMSLPAVKSALHRARSTLADHQASMPETGRAFSLDAAARSQLDAYVRAWERADVEALLGLLKEDATFSMPPIPAWYRGRAEIRALTGRTIFSGQAAGRWRLLPTRANQQPAFGLYRRMEEGGGHAMYGIQVVTLCDGLIADITTFRVPALAGSFGLPEHLP